MEFAEFQDLQQAPLNTKQSLTQNNKGSFSLKILIPTIYELLMDVIFPVHHCNRCVSASTRTCQPDINNTRNTPTNPDIACIHIKKNLYLCSFKYSFRASKEV